MIAFSFLSDCAVGQIQCPADPALTCVNNTLACDGVPDCPNGIDESNDVCGRSHDSLVISVGSCDPLIGCPDGELPVCRFEDQESECLSVDLICDGVIHCVGGQDESLEVCGTLAGMCGVGGRDACRCVWSGWAGHLQVCVEWAGGTLAGVCVE